MTTIRTMIASRLLLTAALFVLAFGCGVDRTAPGPEASDTALLTAEERAERRDALARRWQDLRDRVQELRQQTDADGIQNEWDEAVAEMDREAADLRRELDEFGDDSRQAWTDFEARVQRSLDELGQEIDEAVAKIKS